MVDTAGGGRYRFVILPFMLAPGADLWIFAAKHLAAKYRPLGKSDDLE
jgi:hypothetical protein